MYEEGEVYEVYEGRGGRGGERCTKKKEKNREEN